jgi:ABC-type glycerol-3-phosphate transport system substrate-binding protein
LLLARAAAYAAHREQVTLLFDTTKLEPLIDRPPYVRALEELVASFKASGSVPIETPVSAFTELLAGRCGMALGWPADIQEEVTDSTPVAFAELPGSRSVFSFERERWEERNADEEGQVPFLGAAGRLAAVTSSSGEHFVAEGLVGWLAGTEVSSRVAGRSSGGGFFRTSQRTMLDLWVGGLPKEAAGQYFDVVQHAQSRAQAMTTVRLPGSQRYLSALDAAVQRAMMDGQDPQASLDQAADDWRKITADIGGNEQRTALLHNLGLRTD